MKIRIQGNSIRLRLMQEEVATLSEMGSVEDRLVFGADPATQHLVYRLEAGGTPSMTTFFKEGCVTVRLPDSDARAWISNDVVGFESEVVTDGDESIHVLVEKDFKCIDKRSGEEDCFPNPSVSC
jgi:hypothetical protein